MTPTLVTPLDFQAAKITKEVPKYLNILCIVQRVTVSLRMFVTRPFHVCSGIIEAACTKVVAILTFFGSLSL